MPKARMASPPAAALVPPKVAVSMCTPKDFANVDRLAIDDAARCVSSHLALSRLTHVPGGMDAFSIMTRRRPGPKTTTRYSVAIGELQLNRAEHLDAAVSCTIFITQLTNIFQARWQHLVLRKELLQAAQRVHEYLDSFRRRVLFSALRVSGLPSR